MDSGKQALQFATASHDWHFINHPDKDKDIPLGIVLYKKVWDEDANLVERLENCIGDSAHEYFSWKEATVGDIQKMPDYRECADFKMRESDLPVCDPDFKEAGEIYKEVISGVRQCLNHYTAMYNVKMEYEEATNFVRYKEGEHFAVHSDHGFSYSATISTIGYLNDDYEGGMYVLPYLDIAFKPEAGDLLIQPSTFIYAHQSLPVTKGIKYSAVTMYDYNDRTHQNHGVQQGAYDASKQVDLGGQVRSASS